MNDQEFKEKYDKLKNSKFYQQKMFGWRPLPTISCITIIFVCFAIFFIIMGIIILVFTAQVKEIKHKYYPLERYPNGNKIVININEDMKKPVMVYYQIDGIIQNHRFYMDSKSDKQLKGEKVSPDDLKKDKICESAFTEGEINNYPGYESSDSDDNKLAEPCGLIFKTYLFNDQFNAWELDGHSLAEELEVEGIAYQSDIETYEGVKDDEHFLVWMRPSPFSNPRKLWGRINKDIKQNSKLEVTFTELKHYYGGNKYIILSTRNIFGGKSMFLGICYIIAGGLSLMASVIFITTYSSFHRKN
jgi:hypothetical protein